MSDGELSLSAVIPTYRRPDLLAEVVGPLIADPNVDEVVIVDDGSGDRTEQVCRQLANRSPKVRALHQANAGEAAARFAGAKAATHPLLLVLDDDVLPSRNLGAGHLAHHKKSPWPQVVVGYMPPASPAKPGPADFPKRLYAREYESICRHYEERPEEILLNLWGGHFSVRRDHFLATRYSASKLPFHQDQVLGWRLRELGCSAVFDRTLLATHRYERSPKQYFRDSWNRGLAVAALESTAPAGSLYVPAAGTSAINVAERLVAAAHPLALGATTRAVTLLGALHLWEAQLAAARFTRSAVGHAAYRATKPTAGPRPR